MTPVMTLPTAPMAPISSPEIPLGPDWGYQIKWDGVRTIARLDGHGAAEIFSKRIEPRNETFPRIVDLLKPLRIGACLLDGEIVHFDGRKPNFQRDRWNKLKNADDESALFVIFDMLYSDGEDIRSLPFQTRNEKLKQKFPRKQPRLFVTDLFTDGQALWKWVEEQGWEGIVSKRLSSPYIEGKKHNDWYKKRKQLYIAANVVGIKLKEGRVSSLVLSHENRYIGHVSLGLDEESKRILHQFMISHPGQCPFPTLTPGMKKSDVAWLAVPFPCQVSALEFTESGLLRHPKLLKFG